MWGEGRRRAPCERKSRRMHGCHSGGRLIFCGLSSPAANTSKSPGPSPSQLCSHDKNNNNNKWAGENHCQIWAGLPRAPSPIIFCISCGLGAEMSHYVGQDAWLHGFESNYMSFSPAESWSPAGVVVGSGPRFILPGRWWNCCLWPAHIH